jgi:hypothetical protein
MQPNHRKLLLHCFDLGIQRSVSSGAYLEEVLDALWVVAVALPTDPLHLFDLARLAGRLDVLEVHLWVLTEVDNGAQEVEETWVVQAERDGYHTRYNQLINLRD